MLIAIEKEAPKWCTAPVIHFFTMGLSEREQWLCEKGFDTCKARALASRAPYCSVAELVAVVQTQHIPAPSKQAISLRKDACRAAVLTLIMIRRFRAQQVPYLFWIAPELIVSIAKTLWATRECKEWEPAERDVLCCYEQRFI